MKRQFSSVVISAYRCTSIVDTPMRKVEVLEEQNGTVWLREIAFGSFVTPQVNLLRLEHHESQSLARVLLDLEPPADDEIVRGRKVTPAIAGNGNGDGAAA